MDKELTDGDRSNNNSFLQLQSAVQSAEDLLQQGHYLDALNAYKRILQQRLHICDGITQQFAAADLIIVERLAELATLFGLYEAADNLIFAMVGLCRSENNLLAGDYAHMKRIELAFARGQIQESYSLDLLHNHPSFLASHACRTMLP